MKQGFIYDCYGTLVEPISNNGAKAFLEYVKDKKEWIHRLLTGPISIQEYLYTETFNHVPMEAKSNIIHLLQIDTTAWYPDAHDKIKHHIKQNIPFAILSNLSPDYKANIDKLIIEPYKKYHNDLFKVFYSCDIGYQKPETPAYRYPVNFLRSQGVDHITMIGDNPKYDYLKSKELGINAIWLNRKNQPHNFNPKEVIGSF